jgi:hypothetical protein
MKELRRTVKTSIRIVGIPALYSNRVLPKQKSEAVLSGPICLALNWSCIRERDLMWSRKRLDCLYHEEKQKKKNKRRKERRRKLGVSLKGEWEHCIPGFVRCTWCYYGDRHEGALTGNKCIHLVWRKATSEEWKGWNWYRLRSGDSSDDPRCGLCVMALCSVGHGNQCFGVSYCLSSSAWDFYPEGGDSISFINVGIHLSDQKM